MTEEITFEAARKAYAPRADVAAAVETLTSEELLKGFHPDYRQDSMTTLKVGPNKGDRCDVTLAAVLQANARIDEADLSGAEVTETEVLVIGGGGAGCAAAIIACEAGARTMLVTKLRLGDSNTVMAEGGMQAAIERQDSPQLHYDDTMKGGHHAADGALVEKLVMDGPDTVRWLIQRGMQFDTDDAGNLKTRRPGGGSADRVVFFRDYTGLEMMRTLRAAVTNLPITILPNAPVVELLSDERGHCAGAVVYSLRERKYQIIRAQNVILATGGVGRLHLNGFATSNHFGATADGVVLAYRLGARLRELDTFQYHPSGMAHPEILKGVLITEGVRSAGAYLLNGRGERFVNELKPRDQVTAAIIRECREGRGIRVDDDTVGVWLDTPGLELRKPGIIEREFLKLLHMGEKAGLDPRTSPMLIYPCLHYQNGGVVIDENGATDIPGLFCAGEVSGGIHGRNRLMGNALLDIISFGRRAGAEAARRVTGAQRRKYTLEHVARRQRELTHAGLPLDVKSPRLFPDYANFDSTSAT